MPTEGSNIFAIFVCCFFFLHFFSKMLHEDLGKVKRMGTFTQVILDHTHLTSSGPH